MTQSKDLYAVPRDAMVVLRRLPVLQQVTTWGKAAPMFGPKLAAQVADALIAGKIAGTPEGPFTLERVAGALVPVRCYAADLRSVGASAMVPEQVPNHAELVSSETIDVEAPESHTGRTDLEIEEGAEVREQHVVLTWRWKP